MPLKDRILSHTLPGVSPGSPERKPSFRTSCTSPCPSIRRLRKTPSEVVLRSRRTCPWPPDRSMADGTEAPVALRRWEGLGRGMPTVDFHRLDAVEGQRVKASPGVDWCWSRRSVRPPSWPCLHHPCLNLCSRSIFCRSTRRRQLLRQHWPPSAALPGSHRDDFQTSSVTVESSSRCPSASLAL